MKKKILIVEDIFEQATYYRNTLEVCEEAGNYHIIDSIANTKKDAVTIAVRERPEIILMDIKLRRNKHDIRNLDEEAGIEAAIEILGVIETYVIFLTAVEPRLVMKKVVGKLNHCTFLIKPVNQEQLLASVLQASLYNFKSNEIFVCYAHADAEYHDELQKFLKPLAEVGVDSWSDRKLLPGDEWKKEINLALERASAAILLISIDFINSKFIQEIELNTILRSAEKSGLLVLPVFVRHVPQSVLERRGVLGFQGINSPKNVIVNWPKSKRETEAWGEVCRNLEEKFGRNY